MAPEPASCDDLGMPAGHESPFLSACRCGPVERTPVWFMRQAGRSLPEYRALRPDGSILVAIADAGIAAEITLQPVRRYGVDAAILYSDIVVPVHATGFGVDVVPGKGPVVERPIRSVGDIARLRPLEPATDIPYVIETVRLVTGALASSGVPLIGFAGAPFTVASYLVEGAPTRTFARVKAFMHAEPVAWRDLMDKLATMAATFVGAQVAAGAGAVQLFDSWAGWLSPDEYERHVLPSTRRLLEEVNGLGVPTILFGVGTGELLKLMASAGPDVVGVDWRVPLDEARRRIGPGRAVQGNLDPAICLAPWEVVAAEARRVLDRAGNEPGHIFNLGHGVLPDTDPGVLEALVALVHEKGRAGAGVR